LVSSSLVDIARLQDPNGQGADGHAIAHLRDKLHSLDKVLKSNAQVPAYRSPQFSMNTTPLMGSVQSENAMNQYY